MDAFRIEWDDDPTRYDAEWDDDRPTRAQADYEAELDRRDFERKHPNYVPDPTQDPWWVRTPEEEPMTAENIHVQEASTPVRRTSQYTLDISTPVPNEACDTMVEAAERIGVMLTASGVDKNRAFVRFRVGSDEAAVAIASQLTDLDGVLHTGYGVNRRDIAR
jgi:hypothetical protein